MVGIFPTASTDLHLPVRAASSADFKSEVTTLGAGDVVIQYRAMDADAWTTYTPGTGQWVEVGGGDYDLIIGGAEFTSDGLWVYKVTCVGMLDFEEYVQIGAVLAGAYPVNLTLQSTGAFAVPYCDVCVRNTNETALVAIGRTDENGLVLFNLDAGAYKVRMGKMPRYAFDQLTDGSTVGYPYTLVVTGATTKTLTCQRRDQYYDGLTFGTMCRMVARALSLVYGKTITKEDAQDWVRLGNAAVNAKQEWAKDTYTFVTVANQSQYPINVALKRILYVTVDWKGDGRTTLLRPVTGNQYLGQDDRGAGGFFTNEAGEPRGYWQFRNTINLSPAPSEAGHSITAYVLTGPPLLEVDDDLPDYPAEWHRAIVDYALALGCRDVGMDQKGLTYLQAFEQQMAQDAQPDSDRGSGLMEVS
jgi:hypothetical protein